MGKRTKIALIIGAVAAVVSAIVVVVVFWDKIVALFPCKKKEDCFEEELNDFADLTNN